jgi:hypothetical protein
MQTHDMMNNEQTQLKSTELKSSQVKYPTTGALLLEILEDFYGDNLERFLCEYEHEEDDAPAQYYFNGGFQSYADDDGDDFFKGMGEILEGYFDTYIGELCRKQGITTATWYLKQMMEANDEFGLGIFSADKPVQLCVMAMFLQGEMRCFTRRIVEFSQHEEGLVAFQSLWRGHNLRWKYPCFSWGDKSS